MNARILARSFRRHLSQPRTLVIWALWFCAYFVGYGLSTWLPSLYTSIMKVPLTTALNYALIAQCLASSER